MYDVLKNVVGSSLLYGNTVYFTESGEQVPYILVDSGNNGNYLFMRMFAPNDKVEFFENAEYASSSERIYENHTLDKFLCETFYNRFTPDWKRIFVENRILVTRASDGLSYGINRKVFAPSATELNVSNSLLNGVIPNESETGSYSYFKTNAQSKRKCRLANDNGNYVEYWTRSKNNEEGVTYNYYAISINKNGENINGAWQTNEKFVRPVISINKNVSIINDGGMWRIIPNLPPEKPVVDKQLLKVKNGQKYTLEWGLSTDEDGPNEPKYTVQAERDKSGVWTDVSITDTTRFVGSVGYKEAEVVNYRVRAFDAYNNHSDWVALAEVRVSNNIPPTAPVSCDLKATYQGEPIVLIWDNAKDEDNNLVGYKVYRSIDFGEYELVCTTSTNVFRETAGNWGMVEYRIFSYDSEGEVSNNYASCGYPLSPKETMTLILTEEGTMYEQSWNEVSEGMHEGEELAVFILEDTEPDTEYIASGVFDEGVEIEPFVLTEPGKFDVFVPVEVWRKVRNGVRTFTVTVKNSKGISVSSSFTFEKRTQFINLSLINPVVVDSEKPVERFMIKLDGENLESAEIAIDVTNNANESKVEWTRVPYDKVFSGEFLEFDNNNVSEGNAFRFRIRIANSDYDNTVKLKSISGMFGESLFEYILSRIEILESYHN